MADLDVVGIGNAIVDVLAQVEEGFLARHKLAKGSMTLVDEAAALALYADMPPAVEASGGSAANTIAGIAQLGGACGYLGRVRDDQLGNVFAHDLRSIGVTFDLTPATDGPATARSFVLVTPDGQRTMNTFLGASTGFGVADVDRTLIERAQITYLEGYLFDPAEAQDAFRAARDIAHSANRKVALTLSDAFCVERHREAFRALVAEVDILFANEAEILSLYEVDEFDHALQAVRHDNTLAALTRSEKGSVIVSKSEIHVIDAEKGVTVVDTTGAGDQYAAGFLYGLTHGFSLHDAGRLGSVCAAEVISHLGARPATDMKKLVKEKLGLNF